MKIFPRDRFQQCLFLLFLALFAASCVKPPYLQFLGQQGDIFDGQKDTALATAGAILSMSVLAVNNRWRKQAR